MVFQEYGGNEKYTCKSLCRIQFYQCQVLVKLNDAETVNCPLKTRKSEDLIYPSVAKFMKLLYWKSVEIISNYRYEIALKLKGEATPKNH